jgi:hypothetical protein
VRNDALAGSRVGRSNAAMLVRAPWLVVFALVGCAVAQTAQSFDYPALLQRMVDVDWLWRAPLPGEKCVQFSSYDRASHGGPGDVHAWYANGDRGQHLRVVEKDGAKEFVMVEAKGQGCVARIWSANPSGTLHFDVDGARVWSVDFLALCSGKVDGVPEPLAGMRAKGGNCYLPIPFAKSLVVSCTAGDCYYAFDVVQWDEGVAVESFRATAMEQQASQITADRAKRSAALAPFREQLVPVLPARKVPVSAGRVVRKTVVTFLREMEPLARGELMRDCLLVVRCGDEETVRVPLTAFFAGSHGWIPFTSYLLAIRNDRGLCAFPMPMPRGGSLEIVCERDLGADGPLLMCEDEPLQDADPLLFRASYHLVKGTKTRPFSDHLVLDAKGKGRFVGCSLLVRNPSRIWWGEGDEKFTVDGEAFPSWFGTGTEDYFGYAWCDTALFQSPFHAQIECQGPMNFGFTQLHRTHLLDSVLFQQSFRFDLERWHWVEDVAMDYATVAYWYGAPGATSGLPPVPAAKDRELPRLASPPVLVVDGALEGETLRVVSCSGGTREVQEMWFLEKQFSRDAQLWWRDGKVGDALVLAIPVAEAGRYKVTAALCQADDYGIVQCSLGSAPLGAPFDGYAPVVRSSGPQELGVVELAAGEHELRLQVTGKNDKAKPRHMVGLDYVRLEKLP